MTNENWSHAVTIRPPSTFASGGIHNQSAREVFLEYRKPRVSPNGLGSAIQMVVFYVNRAGRNLPEYRKNELKLAAEFLRIELKHLQLQDKHINFSNEEKVLEVLNGELAFALMSKEFQLARQVKPIYPPPPVHKRIGGRNGYNWKG